MQINFDTTSGMTRIDPWLAAATVLVSSALAVAGAAAGAAVGASLLGLACVPALAWAVLGDRPRAAAAAAGRSPLVAAVGRAPLRSAARRRPLAMAVSGSPLRSAARRGGQPLAAGYARRASQASRSARARSAMRGLRLSLRTLPPTSGSGGSRP